ncbi:MAG: right-handed parallel beta-helix repeat-containing protein [Cryobacterium sp.]|nr:right-handed parallel beta-helix repeat-containing protein [Cryobacterium sp.]
MKPITKAFAALGTLSIVCASFVVGAFALPANAATIAVTNFATLDSAISTANATPGADTITLSGNSADYVFSANLTAITSEIHFVGPGSASLELDAANFSAFSFNTAAVGSISGLSIKDASDDCILNTATDLTLTDVNTHDCGGMGVYSTSGSVSVSNSQSNSNYNFGYFLKAGAGDNLSVDGVVANDNTSGIGLQTTATGSTVSATNITLNNDPFFAMTVVSLGPTATLSNISSQGGPVVFSASAGTLNASNVTVSGSSGDGLRLIMTGGATAQIDQLSSHNNGIGINSQSKDSGTTITVSNSTVSNNQSQGIASYSQDTANFKVDHSTIYGNLNGGIVAQLTESSTIQIEDSTISGNNTKPGIAGSGIYFFGNSDASNSVKDATITKNDSLSTAHAVAIEDVATDINNSIIGGNNAPDDLWASGGTNLSVDYSLVENPNSVAEVTNALSTGAGNLTGLDPKLGPLANNGGTTLTYLPLSGSPVIDAGDPSRTPGTALDQRGKTRVYGAHIDMGAVEVQPELASTGSDPRIPLIMTLALVLAGVGLLGVKKALRNRQPS